MTEISHRMRALAFTSSASAAAVADQGASAAIAAPIRSEAKRQQPGDMVADGARVAAPLVGQPLNLDRRDGLARRRGDEVDQRLGGLRDRVGQPVDARRVTQRPVERVAQRRGPFRRSV